MVEMKLLLERIAEHYSSTAKLEAEENAWHREFGELARAQRIGSGLSLRSMAILMEFSPSVISDLENGHRHWTINLATLYLEIVEMKKANGLSKTS